MLTEYNHMAQYMGYLDTFPLIFCGALKSLSLLFSYSFYVLTSLDFHIWISLLFVNVFQIHISMSTEVDISGSPKFHHSRIFEQARTECCIRYLQMTMLQIFQMSDTSSQLEFRHIHLWDVYP